MFDFFFPKILETRTSKFNGEIKVIKQFGQINILAGGFEQSGALVRKLWKTSFVGPPPTKLNILILGLGCGVAVCALRKKYPVAKIIGIEIDPIMIELGKKYFDLSGLKIICQDALKFKTKQKFNLVLWDLYFGGRANINSINKLVNLLTIDGEIIFNQLCFGKDQIDLESVIVKTNEYVINRAIRTEYNKLIFCSRKKA